MPPSCSYFQCKVRFGQKSFRFPTGDDSRLQTWIKNCGNMTITHLPQEALRSKWICIDHFEKKFIRSRDGKPKHTRLNKLAVPIHYKGDQSTETFPVSPGASTSKARVEPTQPPVTQAPTTPPPSTLRPTTPRPTPQPQPGCALAHDRHYTVGDPTEGYRFGKCIPARVEPTQPPVTQAPTTPPPSTLRPTTPRPTPQPQPGCALAHDRHYTVGDPTEGYRFGKCIPARVEPTQPPVTQAPTTPPPSTLRPTTPRPTPQPQPGCALAHDRHYTVGDPTEGYRFGKCIPARVEPTQPPVTQAPTTPPPSTLRPTTPRPTPQPQPGCALAHDRHYTVGDPTEGYRFGTREDSRIEYAKLPGRQSDELDLMVTLRTFDKHGGVIFYATTERAPEQFLAIFMKDAQIHFTFNCGGDTATIVSPDTYSGTEWHTVTVSRTNGHGKLTVDNQMVGEASVSCNNPVPLAAPYYYGGLRTADSAKTHLGGFYQPFKGCLKGLIMNGQYVTEVKLRVNALRCTDNIEDGVYFGPSTNTSSNYLKLQESNFRVGISLSVSMEIKPRNTTGLLLAVHGKKDYLVLELLENEVVVNVENGKGEFHASYKLAEPTSLCDGNWHKIQVAKARHVVSVGVDNHFGDAGLGTGPSTDTRSALYIGGHEKAVARVRGVRSKRGFTGCIRNIQVREQPVQIPLAAAHRDTHVGACPVD